MLGSIWASTLYSMAVDKRRVLRLRFDLMQSSTYSTDLQLAPLTDNLKSAE